MKNNHNKKVKDFIKGFVFTNVFVCFLFSNINYSQWVYNNNKYQYYDNQSGQIVTNNWIQTNQGYYYLDANGNMVNGWYIINGAYYYFGYNGLMQTGFIVTNDEVYYLDVVSGKMITGWIEVTVDGYSDYYYFKPNGTMAVGWCQINNQWYYFKDGKCMINIWANINKHWYYFGNNGAYVTGWLNQNGKYYYLNPANGEMVTGFVEDSSGNKYYLDPQTGVLAINTSVNINGVTYSFDQTGKATTNQQIVVNTNVYNNTFNTSEIVEEGAQIKVGTAPGQNASAVTSSAQAVQSIQSAVELKEGLTNGPS